MGFTSAGLPNGGQTAHYQIEYDDTLSVTDGVNRAQGLLAACEADFNLMSGWFGGTNLVFNLPLPVQMGNGSSGGAWTDPTDFTIEFGASPTISLNAGSLAQGGTVNVLRYLLVTVVTEMFMLSQRRGNDGWYEPTGLFKNADEGSKGEGLSRFLGVQFQLGNGLGNAPPTLTTITFKIADNWLNANPRPNWVDNNPDDRRWMHPTGAPRSFCTTCMTNCYTASSQPVQRRWVGCTRT